VPKTTSIIAIHGRTAKGNGVSQPFRCEGDDGRNYYVKLKNAGYECLVKEWITGRLAQEMGLPVADVRQIHIPRSLIEGNQEYEQDLGHGIAFGSVKVPSSERLALDFVRNDPDGILSRILLFDWWVRNSDRSLTETGGNPNLVWEMDPGRVVMIDHDNAFDANFDVMSFWGFHALAAHRSAWALGNRQEMTDWLARGVVCLARLLSELPEEWLVDSYGDSRCGLDIPGLPGVLSSSSNNTSFWVIPEIEL
jgi:hypothetical protein